MKATTVKEVLTAARWIIQNVGWCQRSYYKSKKGHSEFAPSLASRVGVSGACATGAILLTVADESLQDDARTALNRELGNGHGGVAYWNDLHERTKEEVLSLFDRAIKRAK